MNMGLLSFSVSDSSSSVPLCNLSCTDPQCLFPASGLRWALISHQQSGEAALRRTGSGFCALSDEGLGCPWRSFVSLMAQSFHHFIPLNEKRPKWTASLEPLNCQRGAGNRGD